MSNLRFDEMWQMISHWIKKTHSPHSFLSALGNVEQFYAHSCIAIRSLHTQKAYHLPPERASKTSFCFCRFLLIDHRHIFQPQISNYKRYYGTFLPFPSFPFFQPLKSLHRPSVCVTTWMHFWNPFQSDSLIHIPQTTIRGISRKKREVGIPLPYCGGSDQLCPYSFWIGAACSVTYKGHFRTSILSVSKALP